MEKWSIVYEKAIRDDGSLFFPERLSHEFLDKAKRTMGSFLFANQYQNEVIPSDEQPFKLDWLKYYDRLPEIYNTFCFIDPAIAIHGGADFTALVVVSVDPNGVWYLRVAQRYKLNPTQIVALIFRVNDQFKPQIIGIEDVAYQKALLYLFAEEIRRRKVTVPLKGVRPDSNASGRMIPKENRILGLVPRFEWGRILINRHLTDFENEYAQFPRGTHDDLIDSLAYLEQLVYYPKHKGDTNERPNSPADPNYEKWYIQNIHRLRAEREENNF